MPIKFLFFDLNEQKINEYKKILGHIKNTIFECNTLDEIFQKYDVDILVSPANSYGIMTGGIDRDIAKKYPMVVKNVNDRVSVSKYSDSAGRKYIPVGACEAVNLDNDKKILLIVPTMLLPKNIIDTQNVKIAFTAMLKKIKVIHDSKYNVLLACPCLGTGVGQLTGTYSANQILDSFHDQNIL